jgi:aminoglycoside phosphotransferase (APT) family kinase protein
MHPDEVHTDTALVRRLLEKQFPQWAHLPLERVPSSGTDNALYRLGAKMVVRLPRIHWALGAVEKDLRWLPVLAPHLPVAIPVPLAKGAPADGYPWEWGIYPWLEGENPVVGGSPDAEALARDVGRFIDALHRIDAPGGPSAGRGVPLELRDEPTRDAIAELEGMVDTDAVTVAWEAALETRPWPGPPVWVHGDVAPGNLLVDRGRLSGVIDWGGSGLGDPECDLIVAWNLLPTDAREVFRAEVAVDDATWVRGRGWALSVALIQLPYYKDTNPDLAANARYVIGEVLAERNRSTNSG